VHGSTTVTTNGTVIDGWDIHGYLIIDADNVLVRNTRVRCVPIDGECTHTSGDGLLMSHVDIGPDSGNLGIAVMDGGGPGAVASRNIYEFLHIHNVTDGIRCDGGFTLRESYIHAIAGGHSDSCQGTQVGNMLFDHNTMVGGDTSCVFLQIHAGGVIIRNNYLLAGSGTGWVSSYAVLVADTAPQGGVQFRDNVLGRGWQSGPDGSAASYHWTGLWSGNTYTDGTPIGVPHL
jgi:hypothetical protein